MDKNFKRTLVTTALPYANGPVHIGHLAGVYVPADIYVRYLRAKGQEVMFIGGSDEHGVPITISKKVLKNWVSVSTYTAVPHQRHTTKQPLISSANCMTRGNLSKRPPCSYMTRKPDSSWPTAM